MNANTSVDTYNLIQILIKKAYFPKNDFMHLSAKNSLNFTCGQYFFMKLAPLCSVDTELSIHTKNSIFMKNPQWSLFS